MSATFNCESKQILILILTDSVIINIVHIIHTVLDLKSKHYKSNVVRLSTEAAARRCTSKQVFLKMLQYSQQNICFDFQACNSVKKVALTQVFLCMLLKTPFSIKHLRWLLLYLLEREEEESVEQKSGEKNSNERRK